jgi:secreted PhoX family phosphatase
LSKFANSGQAVSPSTGYTGALSSSFDLAIDSAGNAWAPNSATSSLAKFSNSGTALTTGLTGGGLSAPSGIAIDGSGNVWVANDNAYSVSEFSNAGVAITPSTGYAGSLFGPYLSPQNIAVDGSGNVWLACAVSSSGPVPVTDTVLELVGAATPVITPIAAGLPSTFTSDGSSNLGTRP